MVEQLGYQPSQRVYPLPEIVLPHMVDCRSVELRPLRCKRSVLPLSLTAHKMVPSRGTSPRSPVFRTGAFN